MPTMMKTAEKALHKQSNKLLAGATKRYKKFIKLASKAASEHKREQYMAGALSALVVTGVVASRLMTRMENKAAKLAPVKLATAKKK
jgi:F0F1-type ATP synthase assembly protein I